MGAAPAVAQQLGPGPVQAPRPEPGKQVYSPWTKFCSTPSQTSAVPPICFTGREMLTASGEPIAAVALIEPAGAASKIFRVTVPAPLQLRYGTRLIVDRGEPFTAPYFTCSGDSCVSDYEASPALIGKLRAGQTLEIQAIELNEKPISLHFSLGDFAKAADGPPTDARKPAEDPSNLAGGPKK